LHLQAEYHADYKFGQADILVQYRKVY